MSAGSPEPTSFALQVAWSIVESGRAAQQSSPSGLFRFGLCGGRSPLPVYQCLASLPFSALLDWKRVVLVLSDERTVPAGHPDSNFGLLLRTLARPLGIPPTHMVRPQGDATDLALEAALCDDRYAPVDLLLLGLGDDGHVASLFPHSPLLHENRRRFAVVTDSPKPPSRRLTITPRVIHEARRVLVLAVGAAKGDALARALAPGADPWEVPAALARHGDWFVDMTGG
jgi:6-phosphogluconolactonase